MSVELLKKELSKLSRHQKVEVMHFLIEDVAEEPDGFELTEELITELDRREAAIKNGTAKRYTWEEVRLNVQDKGNRPNKV